MTEDNLLLLGPFRLAGQGGAALFLRTFVSLTSVDGGRPVVGLTVDVGLISPERLVQYRGRPVTDRFVARLGRHLFRGAAETHPELSVESFNDPACGLSISYVGSTAMMVEVDVLVLDDVGGDVQDEDGLNFKTSRAALAAAAHAVRRLEGTSTNEDEVGIGDYGLPL